MYKLQSTNPAKNYEVVGEVEISSLEEIKSKVKLAQTAKKVWAELTPVERVGKLWPLIKKLQTAKEDLAQLITKEMGKPIDEAREEVEDSMADVDFFLKNGPKYLAEEVIPSGDEIKDLVWHEPWGVAVVIAPWNWPLEMPIWGLIPVLVSGNTVVFKPSEESPLVGRALGDLVAQLDLPVGVFNLVQGDGQVGVELLKQDIDLIWFTGSNRVGQQVYALAGQKFIKAVVELGGSSPAIVFEDAVVDDQLIAMLVKGRFLNCGQSCTAIKRLLVHQSKMSELVEKLVSAVKKMKVGDPLMEGNDLGSLVAKRQLDLVVSQVTEAIEGGAKIECGGRLPEGLVGAYYLPTVLTNISPEMRVWQEEVFAPVLPIMVFKTEEEAIRLANQTDYGLSAQVYTTDSSRALRVARQIKAGRIRINTAKWGSLECPFGGYKKSGMGREHGRWGFEELTQIKHVMVG